MNQPTKFEGLAIHTGLYGLLTFNWVLASILLSRPSETFTVTVTHMVPEEKCKLAYYSAPYWRQSVISIA